MTPTQAQTVPRHGKPTIRQAVIDGNSKAIPKICKEWTVAGPASWQHFSINGLWQRLQLWLRTRRRGKTS